MKLCALFQSHQWNQTPNSAQNRLFFYPVWPSNLTDVLEKQKGTSPMLYQALCIISSHMWIPTGVIAQKRLNWVLTAVTLIFDFWPWPFAWISLLSMVKTPENSAMIRWEKHCEKGVKDGRTGGRTDGRTDRSVLRAAWSQLKYVIEFGNVD